MGPLPFAEREALLTALRALAFQRRKFIHRVNNSPRPQVQSKWPLSPKLIGPAISMITGLVR
jgi:hypothetical protein